MPPRPASLYASATTDRNRSGSTPSRRQNSANALPTDVVITPP